MTRNLTIADRRRRELRTDATAGALAYLIAFTALFVLPIAVLTVAALIVVNAARS